MSIRKILGILIVSACICLIIFGNGYLNGIAVFVVSIFELLALSMNYKRKGGERNAWDVWFFSMPGIIVALLFVGIIADDRDVWKYIAIAMGGTAGLESLSSFIKARRK